MDRFYADYSVGLLTAVFMFLYTKTSHMCLVLMALS